MSGNGVDRTDTIDSACLQIPACIDGGPPKQRFKHTNHAAISAAQQRPQSKAAEKRSFESLLEAAETEVTDVLDQNPSPVHHDAPREQGVGPASEGAFDRKHPRRVRLVLQSEKLTRLLESSRKDSQLSISARLSPRLSAPESTLTPMRQGSWR